MVLLGDPQQLAQPHQAVHPEESGAPALEHLLDGHAPIPSKRGVFLDRWYRTHPHLTAFVSDLGYEAGRRQRWVVSARRCWARAAVRQRAAGAPGFEPCSDRHRRATTSAS
jgi:hypothetical protein